MGGIRNTINNRKYRTGDTYYQSRAKRTYGADFKALNEEQQGLCKICQSTCSQWPRLSVDHDHHTGKVRGLLCSACNKGLANYRDSPELLRRAAAYLEDV